MRACVAFHVGTTYYGSDLNGLRIQVASAAGLDQIREVGRSVTMAFRFAVGGISHETNTYCKDQTPLEQFRVWRGKQIVDNSRGVRTYIGG